MLHARTFSAVTESPRRQTVNYRARPAVGAFAFELLTIASRFVMC